MKKILLSLSITGLLFLIPNQAKADDVVYSTFGPSDSYQQDIGWTVGLQSQVAPDYEDFMEPAAAFTPTANYNLTSVQAAISLYSGTNSVELLLTNSINNQPGSTIESWLLTNQMGPLGADNTPLSANSVGNIELSGGDQYWLVAENPNSTSTAAWNFSNTDGLMLDSANGGAWFNLDTYYPNQGAFEIDGTPAGGFNPQGSPVPEPMTMGLFAFGLLAMAGFTMRRQLRLTSTRGEVK